MIPESTCNYRPPTCETADGSAVTTGDIHLSKGIVYSWIAYFAFLLFTVINHVIFNLLKLEPRTWVTVLVWLVITLTPFFLIFFMLLKGIRICTDNIAKGLLIFVLVIYPVISMGFLFLLGLRGMFNLEEEKILEDGSILVTKAGFPDGTTVNTQETLTYDRISKNGKCHLFVYYEEHYDTDGNKLDNTSILNSSHQPHIV